MRTLISMAGHIGATFVNGTFIRMDSGMVAFCRKVGVDGNHRWVPADLPTEYRTQLDVRSTGDALNARSIGGVVSANIVGGHNAVAWKKDRVWSLEDLANDGRLSLEDYNGICEFYELEG